MISSLGDQYSEYLDPSAFRAAIKRPTKAELDYLAQQAVGAVPPNRIPAVTTVYGSTTATGHFSPCALRHA